eukprot:Partr_v1_DN27940_c0_g1_i2_m11760 putative Centrosomal protein
MSTESEIVWTDIAALPLLEPLKEFTAMQAMQVEKVFGKIADIDVIIPSHLEQMSNQSLVNIIRQLYNCTMLKQNQKVDAETEVRSLSNDLRTTQTVLDSIDNSQVYLDELRTLQLEIDELTERNANAMLELQKSESDRDRLQLRIKELNKTIETGKDRERDLEEVVAKLQRDMDSSKSSRLLTKSSDNESRVLIREKNQEISNCLDEIKRLKAQNGSLNKEVAELTDELESLVSALEKSSSETTALRKTIEDLDGDNRSLTRERDMLQGQMDNIAQQLDVKDNMEESVMAHLQDQLSSWRDTLASYQSELAEKEEELLVLKELQNGRGQDMLKEKDEAIAKLQAELGTARKDFELLSLDWERSRKNASRSSLRSGSSQQLSKSQLLSSKPQVLSVDSLDDETKEHLRTLEANLHQKQDELIELGKRMDQYETGYGIREAMDEVRSLKIQISVRDDNILDLTAQVNQLLREIDGANEHIAIIQNGSVYDMDNVHTLRTTELDRVRALNRQLQLDNDAMEEERISLKKEIRLLVSENPQDSVLNGLSSDQKMQVMDLVDDLKTNRTIRRPRSRVSTSNTEFSDIGMTNANVDLERLYHELRVSNEERVALKAEHENIRKQQALAEKLISSFAQSFESTSVAGDITQVLTELEKLTNGLQISNDKNAVQAIFKLNSKLARDLTSAHSQIEILKTELASEKSRCDHAVKQAEKYQETIVINSSRPPQWFESIWSTVMDATGGGQETTKLWANSLTNQLVECLHDLELKGAELKKSLSTIANYEKELT